MLGDAALAADAVQEAFLTVYRKGGRFEARARFTSWLHRVVVNQAIDLRRRERRHRAAPLAAASGSGDDDRSGAPEPSADPTESPPSRALATERAHLVHAAVARLSPKLAEVIVLRYPESRSYEEIGELLGVPPGTVKSRLNRAHAALRGMLGSRLDPRSDGDDTIS